MGNILSNLDYKKFFQLLPERQMAIDQAEDALPKAVYPANELAEALHPKVQHMLISEIVQHGANAKSYTLIPNEKKGTGKCAYFSAGQYVRVTLEVGGASITRPYSIRSAPKDALDGKYVLTIKRVADGFGSNYILDNWKVGDEVTLSAPAGNFKYEPIRDAKTVVGLAGGSGITPFYSLASAIADGTEDANLILLYGSTTKDNILLKEEFDKLEAECPKIKVIHVLSHETLEGYETGFLSKELIETYLPDEEYSIFVCGPKAMYRYVDTELQKLGIEKYCIRHELFGECHAPADEPDYPCHISDDSFVLTIHNRDKEYKIQCKTVESLLTAMERAGIKAPSLCRSGECGYCHSRLIKGNVFIPESVDHRRLADYDFGYVHPCCTFPLGDVCIEIATV